MTIKGLLVDLDNTLYDYEIVHPKALKAALQYLSSHSKISFHRWNSAYDQARAMVHDQLKGTAASHNRLLYFQLACESLKLKPFDLAYKAYDLYWQTFIQYIKPFPGLDRFLKSVQRLKVCLITDLTADIQYQKIKKLKLGKYFDAIVTSEEAGVDKPHPRIFRLALKKLGLNEYEAVMIGDDFQKDILGAAKLGVKSVWFNAYKHQKEFSKSLPIVECKNMLELIHLIHKL